MKLRRRRRTSSGGRRLLATVVLGASLAGCGLALGLDRLPARGSEEDASAPDAFVGGDGAASDASDAGSFCARADGSLFCEDFDVDEPVGARWSGVGGGLVPPVASRNATGSRFEEASSSAPASLRIVASSADDKNSSYFFLVHELGAVPHRGLLLSADVRVLAMTDRRDASAPPDDSGASSFPSPRTSVMGLLATAGTTASGAQIMVSSGFVAIYAGTILSDVGRSVVPVAEFDVLGASRIAWLRVSLAVGQRDAVLARAKQAIGVDVVCPDTKAVAIAWPSVPLQTAGCVAVDDVLADLSSRSAGLDLGLGLGDPADATVLLDSVRVDPIP